MRIIKKPFLKRRFPIFILFAAIPCVFQKDNAPNHTARVVKEWIQSQNVNILESSLNSPDLNIIENIWGLLSHKVYDSEADIMKLMKR